MDIASGGIVPLAVAAGVFGAGGLLGQLFKHRIHELRPFDQLRAASYLTRFSTALEYAGTHKQERREHVDALRADLRDSAEGPGLDAAFERLGPPRKQAANVTLTSRAPSWLRGLLWVLLVAVAAVLATTSFAAGFETAASADHSATWSGPLSTSIDVTVDETGHVSTVDLTAPAAMPTAVVIFLVGSRAWRLITQRPCSS